MVAITVATNVTIRTGAQGIPGIPGTAAPHAVDHEAGGDDEVTIEDLVTTGTLGQVPTATASNTMVMATPTAVITAHGALTGLTPGDAGHTDLQLRSEKGQALGYAELDAGTLLDGAKVPYGSASDTATEGNDSRVPTQGENDALVGTNGTPATGNPYVTDSDPRNTDARTPTAHTILSHDTDTTGAELTSLADGSDADLLHDHAIADAHIASTANPHGTDIGNLGSGTLAELNTAVTDATLDTSSASRPPSGSASGDLGGSFPSPSVAALTTTTGPTSLTIGAIADGEVLVRSGSTVVGSAAASGDVVGPSGGVVDGEIALYNSTTGKLIKGSSTQVADLVADADLIDSSAGAGDAGKPIKLDAGGALDSTIAEPPGSIATHTSDADAHHAQVHTIASHDTGTTGAELTSLADGSDADALHVHALADTHIADTANPHGTDLGNLGSGTLAELNAAVTDATLDDASDPRTPTAHASTHSDGGSDEVNVEDLASAGADGQVVASDGAGALVLSNGMIQNSKTGMVDVLTNLISINAGDPAKVDIRASQGVVINFDPDPTSPTVVPLVWAVPFEAIALPGLAANIVTAVFVVDSGGGVPVIELSNVFPTPEDIRTKLLVGFAFHAGSSVVDAVASAGVTAFDTGSSLDDLMSAIGDFNLSGNIYSANGANLLLDKGLGESFGRGLNPAEINNQHHLINALQSGITAYDYSYRDAGSGFNTSLESTIDPNFYDDGSGTLAATSNKYTIQRLVFTPRGGGLTAVEYGQKLYNSLNDAIDGISANGIIKNPDFSSAILRGWLVVQGNTTDLTNVADAAFRENHFEIAQPSGAGTDVNAIHVDGSNEISGITPKTALVAGDLLVIEDSAAGNIKKSVAFSSLDARYAELAGATFSGVVNMGGNEILDVSFLGITDSGTPRLVLTETSADLDEKLWGISNNVGNYRLEAIDDAFGSVTLALGFQRTGMVLDLCTIGSDLTVQGEVTASEPTTSTSLTTRGFVEALVQGIDWQQSVISDVLATPPAHVEGARYLIPAGATGDWSGNVDDITQSVSSVWVFTTAAEGMTVAVDNIVRTRRFTSGAWVSLGSTIDHGNTIGLGDDDHTQYFNQSRGDARYAELSGAAFTGAITTTSTFDGRDVDADGTAQDTHIADTANPHGTTIANITGTLAQLNTTLGVTLDVSSASRTPTSHASSHSDGGSDEIKIEDLGATSTDDTLVFGPDGSGGVEVKTPATGFESRYYEPRDMNLDGGSDMAVSTPMVEEDDNSNGGIPTMRGSGALNLGFGINLPDIPTGAVNMQITIQSRSRDSPSGEEEAVVEFYERDETTSVGSWGSAISLDDFIFPDSDVDWKNIETDKTLTAWGLTVGNQHRIQIVMTSASTVGVAYFRRLKISFS